MLPAKPSAETVALNRVTFGARDTDVERVRQMGWAAWVAEQLAPPPGDDPDLAAHLADQRMRIVYNGQPKTDEIPGWPDVNELRPLNYMNASVKSLWQMAQQVEVSVAANELTYGEMVSLFPDFMDHVKQIGLRLGREKNHSELSVPFTERHTHHDQQPQHARK